VRKFGDNVAEKKENTTQERVNKDALRQSSAAKLSFLCHLHEIFTKLPCLELRLRLAKTKACRVNFKAHL
jgi:hypothetical protein